MSAKFTNVLSTNEVEYLADIIENSPTLLDDIDQTTLSNSKSSGNIPELNQFTKKIEHYVRLICSDPIIPINSFSRVYTNGSFLGIHADRVGLDITVSLCLRKDPNINWPIYVSKKPLDNPFDNDNDKGKEFSEYKKDFHSFDLEPGDIAIMFARKYLHWRDPLTCDPNKKFIYSFFSWRVLPNPKNFSVKDRLTNNLLR